MTLLAHLEGKLAYIGGKPFAVSALETEARANNCVLVVVGCNAGAHTSGSLGELNSVEAVSRVVRAMDAADLKGILTALASPEHPLVIDGALVKDVERVFVASTAKIPVPPDGHWEGEPIVVKLQGKAPDLRLATIIVPAPTESHSRPMPPTVTAGSSSSSTGNGGTINVQGMTHDAGSSGLSAGSGGGMDAGRTTPDAALSNASAGGGVDVNPKNGIPWGAVFAVCGFLGAAGAWITLRRDHHDGR